MKKIVRNLFDRLPKKRTFSYRICKKYVDYFNSENNADIFTNGELELMRNSLNKCEIVFDVGANVGNWAKLALAINPDIILHCFEPSKFTFQRLVSNNFPPNVVCNNLGLGTAVEERTLFVYSDGSGENSLYQRCGLEDSLGKATQKRSETVKLTTLDDYCQENKISNVDFLKIDVEGHELAVLKGAGQLLEEKRIKMIQFEYGGCCIDARTFLADIFSFFSCFDYDLFKVFPTRLRCIRRYDQRLDNFQYANYAAVLKGIDSFPKFFPKDS